MAKQIDSFWEKVLDAEEYSLLQTLNESETLDSAIKKLIGEDK